MFGGPARMFPQTPLWLSTGLVRPIKYSEERQLEKMATAKWLINDVLNWTWNESNVQHSCKMPFTVFLFPLLLLPFLPMLSFSVAVFTGCRYYLLPFFPLPFLPLPLLPLPILPLPFFPWIMSWTEAEKYALKINHGIIKKCMVHNKIVLPTNKLNAPQLWPTEKH